METKICNKCGVELPMTIEYFYTRRDSKDGYRNICKRCHIETIEKCSEVHKEDKAKYMKQYCKKNKEILSKKHRQYYKKNKEAFDNHNKKYYEENKETLNDLRKKYYKENKKDVLNRVKLYRKKHKDKYSFMNGRRRARKLALPSTLIFEQWNQIKEHFNNKCCYCGRELPLEQEHFIPLSKGGEYTINNIVPACKSCNSSKSAQNFLKWYPKHEYYSKEREIAILDFLGYKGNKQQLSII